MPTWPLFLAFLAVTSSLPDGQTSVLFSLFSVIRRAAAGNQLPPLPAPPSPVILSEYPPVRFHSTHPEPPTTSELELRSDGSFETCFAFFFLPVFFFFFFLRDLGRLELAADQSDSPTVVASEAPKPRPPRSSSECVTGPEAPPPLPPPAAVQTAGIKIKFKKKRRI